MNCEGIPAKMYWNFKKNRLSGVDRTRPGIYTEPVEGKISIPPSAFSE
jgi:hypothetical protein